MKTCQFAVAGTKHVWLLIEYNTHWPQQQQQQHQKHQSYPFEWMVNNGDAYIGDRCK